MRYLQDCLTIEINLKCINDEPENEKQREHVLRILNFNFSILRGNHKIF